MTKYWLALLLMAAVPLWAAGCGGGTEEPAGGNGGGTEEEEGHGHDGEEGHEAEGGTEEGGTEEGGTEEGGTEEGGTEEGGTTEGGTEEGGTEEGGTEEGGTETSSASPDTAEGTVLYAVEALKAEDPGKLWALLPASYQKDLNDVVHGYAAKMPEEAWTKTFALVGKSLDTLKAKKDFVLAHPLVAFNPAIKVDDLKEAYDPTIDVLSAVVKSDLGDLEKLRTADAGELLDSIGGQLAKEFATIATALPDGAAAKADMDKSLNSVKVETLEATDETAKLAITSLNKTVTFRDDEITESWEEKTEEVEFVKVEGKWIPADMANEFKGQMDAAKATLEGLPQEQIDVIAGTVLGQVDAITPLVDGLAAAETQDDFNTAVDQVMQYAQQLMGPPGGPGPPGPPPGIPGPPE